jgi:hypothetical protein
MMMDPAVLGTAIIGLEAIRADEATSDRTVRREVREARAVRRQIAVAMRRYANALDPAGHPDRIGGPA